MNALAVAIYFFAASAAAHRPTSEHCAITTYTYREFRSCVQGGNEDWEAEY
ncbi:hypothetical protein HIM_00795 [Hirsutella minnesotensis 3608]|nr:hypothetical protein HIM_00795 [Hirsutella minnesotensis 3608]